MPTLSSTLWINFATGPNSTVCVPNGLTNLPSEVPPDVPKVGSFPVTSLIAWYMHQLELRL